MWRENPVLRQLLGLCPSLAVTNTVGNSLAMGAATAFVLVGSSFFVSVLRKRIAPGVRLSSYVLIVATFVTVVDMVMAAEVPTISKALGPFVYLIVVNCMILSRHEAFSSKQPVSLSLLDAIGTSAGFTLALFMMGTVREVLGSGSFLGFGLFGPHFEPWVVMALPPGGFFTIGSILLVMEAWRRRGAQVTHAQRANLHSTTSIRRAA